MERTAKGSSLANPAPLALSLIERQVHHCDLSAVLRYLFVTKRDIYAAKGRYIVINIFGTSASTTAYTGIAELSPTRPHLSLK